jgi:hypothetical protein
MAKKAKYKSKPKKYPTGIQDLQSDNPQGSGLASKFNGAAGGATAIFNNFSDAMNLGHSGDIQAQSNAAGDSTDNPYKQGVGGQAMAKGGLAGAKAGFEVGGPIGAAVGGVLGVASGVFKGQANAEARKKYQAYNDARLKQRVIGQQMAKDDPYQNLKYVKGTKYKHKANQKLDEKAKSKANIEFEGGEPIFSPKKKDGSRDLLYFDKNGPKHSEGGIPAKVVAKGQYKTKSGKGPMEVPEGSAIVTAKKNQGTQAVIAHKMGKNDVVEKIISKMPEDKAAKKADGDSNLTTKKAEAVKKVNRTGKTLSTTEADNKKNYSYKLKNLSPEDAAAFKEHKANFENHQKVLADKRHQLGRDLNYNEQKKAFDDHNSANGTKYSLDNYHKSINGIDDIAKKQGVDINMRGDQEGTEGKSGGNNQAGMFGWRNASARFDYDEQPAGAPASNPGAAETAKQVEEPVNLAKPNTGTSNPATPSTYKMRGPGIGLRASDVNNMYRGSEAPEVEHYDKIPTYNQSYYDLSDPARRQSLQAAKMQSSNAVNLSGGSAGNARANMASAYADNANRQQGINAFELGRFGEIKNANAQNKQNVAAQNTSISNEEKNVNAANRQATKDQFQTGLVGFDENNYRNKVTNDQYNVDMQKNDIERKRLNLLKGYVPNYNADEDYNIGLNKKADGAKKLKYKTKKKS